jgi:fatty-acyl-CoA synthase
MLPGILPLARFRPGSRETVPDRLESLARTSPKRLAIVYGDVEWSFAAWNEAANRVAHWALASGLGAGDVVALVMENRPQFLAIWAGLAKLGIVTALVNTQLSGRALGHCLAAATAKVVVMGNECVDRAREGLAQSRTRLFVAGDPETPNAPLPEGAVELDGELARMPAHAPSRRLRAQLRARDDLFYIYTSGTTGLPKAARFSHMRFLLAGAIGAQSSGLRAGDVHYCVLPLYHSAAGVMQVSSVLFAGATLALRRRFSASAFWDDVREVRATHFQYVGELCRYLVNQPRSARDRDHGLRVAIGNGLRADVWTELQRRFAIPEVVEFYSATEGAVSIMNLENRIGSVGRFPFRSLTNARIIRYDVEMDAPRRGPDGLCNECEPNEIGELVGRIPRSSNNPIGRFEGYTSRHATSDKILRDVLKKGDEFFRTGDLMRQDARGFFYFVDRIGDTFRWKGENVSTEEVASALMTFPGVETATVYGVRVDGHEGRAGMAALEREPSASFDGSALYAHVTRQLPRYAAPLFVRLLSMADMTSTFKLRKVALREEGYDAARVRDPIFVRDDLAGSYVPFSAQARASLAAGSWRV